MLWEIPEYRSAAFNNPRIGSAVYKFGPEATVLPKGFYVFSTSLSPILSFASAYLTIALKADGRCEHAVP